MAARTTRISATPRVAKPSTQMRRSLGKPAVAGPLKIARTAAPIKPPNTRPLLAETGTSAGRRRHGHAKPMGRHGLRSVRVRTGA